MKRRFGKVVFLTLVVLFIVSLSIMPGCTESAPKPAKEPVPATTHEPINVILHTASFGGTAYVVGFGMEQIVRKVKHPWLTVTCLEGMGAYDNLITVEGLNPERRKYRVWLMGGSLYEDATNGLPPFKRKYTEPRGVFSMGAIEFCFVTLDPKIKKVTDLVGKRVAAGPKGSGFALVYDRIVRIYGIDKEVKTSYMSWPAGANALRDGTMDAVMVMSQRGKPGEAFVELFASLPDKLYYVGHPDKAIVDKINSEVVSLYYQAVPPKFWGPTQTEATGTIVSLNNTWWAWQDAPDDVIYEMVKTIAQNMTMFKAYCQPGGEPLLEEMGIMPVTDAGMHPGALKYYKEAKIKIGVR